jgi:hypothetical protein
MLSGLERSYSILPLILEEAAPAIIALERQLVRLY